MIQTTTPVRLTAGIRVAAEGTDLARFIIGPAGQSAYELAVENGFDGTISEWLDSLRGQGGDGGGGVDLSGYLTRTETEAGDAATLASAMDYTDTLSAAEEQARVDGDTATLAAAQEYADGITPPAPDLTGYATDEDLAGEATARSDADAALGARIDALPAPAPPYDDSAVRQLIATEATTRSDADAALDSRVDALEAVPAPDLTGLATDAELTAEATARADGDAATLAAAQAYADQVTGADPTGLATDEDLAAEATARADGDAALDARVDALEAVPAPDLSGYATTDALSAAVADEATARTDADTALDARVDALEAVPAPDLTGLATDAELTAEATARADADAALAGSTLRVVHHGSDGTTARPDAAAAVYWIGSAEPVNALPADLWRAS